MLAFGSFSLFIAFLRKARNFPCFSFIRSIFSFLIAQKIFALKTRRTKLKPQFRKIVCLMLAFGSFSLFDTILTKDTDCSVSFSFSLDFQFSNRAENLCYQNKTDKTQTAIPCECLLGELRLSAGFPRSLRSLGMTMVGHPHPNGYIFEAFLYTVCAHSKTKLESQGDDRIEHQA